MPVLFSPFSSGHAHSLCVAPGAPARTKTMLMMLIRVDDDVGSHWSSHPPGSQAVKLHGVSHTYRRKAAVRTRSVTSHDVLDAVYPVALCAAVIQVLPTRPSYFPSAIQVHRVWIVLALCEAYGRGSRFSCSPGGSSSSGCGRGRVEASVVARVSHSAKAAC